MGDSARWRLARNTFIQSKCYKNVHSGYYVQWCCTAQRQLKLGGVPVAGAMKLEMHHEGAANPILQYFTPKMDDALSKVHSLTGLHLPVDKEQYATIIFAAGALELLGGVLFTLNVKAGAVILVSRTASS